MSDLLFLASPSHGHVNATLGLVDALVKHGQRVTYFASEPFRERVQATGATFKAYAHDLDMFKGPPARAGPALRDAGRPFARRRHAGRHLRADPVPPLPRPGALGAVPVRQAGRAAAGAHTVASRAVFAGLGAFVERDRPSTHPMLAPDAERDAVLHQAAADIGRRFGIGLSTDLREWIFNPGELSLVYTSRLFAGELPQADASYRFVGPPVHARGETTDFPLERLAGRRVLYISLGTVFGQCTAALVDVFIAAFAHWDGLVVMTACGVDTAEWRLPANFIVRPYVPQGEILKHAAAAITHAGMNSISDLLAAEVPFVCLPLGADQPALASRARELVATIVLDHATVTARQLEDAVIRVTTEPSFRAGIHAIAESFRAAGGYPKAADEVFAWKTARGLH